MYKLSVVFEGQFLMLKARLIHGKIWYSVCFVYARAAPAGGATCMFSVMLEISFNVAMYMENGQLP